MHLLCTPALWGSCFQPLWRRGPINDFLSFFWILFISIELHGSLSHFQKTNSENCLTLHTLLGTTISLPMQSKSVTSFLQSLFPLPIHCSTHYKFPCRPSIQPVPVLVSKDLLVTKSMGNFQNCTLLTILSFLNALFFPWLPKYSMFKLSLLLRPLSLSLFWRLFSCKVFPRRLSSPAHSCFSLYTLIYPIASPVYNLLLPQKHLSNQIFNEIQSYKFNYHRISHICGI